MNKSIFLKTCVGLLLTFSNHLFSAGVFAYVTNARDNTVSVINTSTNTVVTTIPVGFFPTDVAASPDGNFVYVPMYASDAVYAISTATNTTQNVIVTPRGAKPIGIAVAPTGMVYCTNFSNATVFVIDPNSMNEIDNFTVGSIFPVDIAITPDGTKAYVVNAVGPKNVKMIDLSTNNVTATLNASQQSLGVAIKPDSTTAYVTNPMQSTVSVINTSTNTITATITLAAGSFPRGIAVRPDGAFAYVVLQGTSSVGVINTATNTLSTTISLTSNSDPYNIAITPDGTQAYVTQTLTGNVSVINLITNLVTGTISVGNFPFSVDIANVP